MKSKSKEHRISRYGIIALTAILFMLTALPLVASADEPPVYTDDDLSDVALNEVTVMDDLPAPITSNRIGTFRGFDYEFWSELGDGVTQMQLTGPGTFTCSWEDARNILFRTGKKLGSVMSYKEYGDVTIDYQATHNIQRGSVSYLTAYGWTQRPLMEWYIVEKRGSYMPGRIHVGTAEIDGSIYDIRIDTRVNQPSIEGNRTFAQIYSIRRNHRIEGVITVSDHFKAWEALGLDVSGRLYEVSMCIEGYNSSGNGSITKHILKIGDTVYGELPPPDPKLVAFIESLYQNIQGREPDSGGLEFWVRALQSGTHTGASTSGFFFFSDEYIARNRTDEEFINDLYNTCMGRDADDGGMDYWLSQMAQGASRKLVLNAFLTGPEFAERCAEFGVEVGRYTDNLEFADMSLSITRFIFRCYDVFLDRIADRVGLNNWTGHLINKVLTPTEVAREFVFSEEFEGFEYDDEEFLDAMYQGMMGREPDEGGYNHWMSILNDNPGPAGRQLVFNGFAQSEEWKAIVADFGL